MSFKGFSQTAIGFLKELAANNRKDWFEQHRTIYEEHLLTPLKQLVVELELTIKNIDSKIDSCPAINKTISKIYRDTRFSGDKSPFRTNAWITFKRPVKEYGNVPEFYFYFTPEEYQYGMGFYAATSLNMQKIRENIIAFPDSFKKIIDYYDSQKTFVLVGADYKKIISNPLPKAFQKWIQKKNLCLSCIKKIDTDFFSPKLKDELVNACIVNSKLYHFFIESINQ